MKETRKTMLTPGDIAYIIDASTLKLDTSREDVNSLIEACKKYRFGCAFAWPACYELLREKLKGTGTAFGTSLSFPSGQETTFIKVAQAHYFESLGAAEVDMVMNIGWLKSKQYRDVTDDIKAVRQACKNSSLKVIIEAMLLTDEEIATACAIVIDAGANYVKSGTGFSAAPTTIHHVETMKAAIGDTIKLKVAGGVRDLKTLVAMYKKGADRFGIGLPSAVSIMEEALALPGNIDVESEELRVKN
ncbi:MAG: deoxyribose-phosphate aldolase [Prevotellaceae bacterium]|jgi:deoxyribose-phosphate aldolase|nr:deoxyribose-phosphate aldolase [Prevotellaceae bacterium]